MAGVVSLAALDVMPIGVAAIIAIGVILATRCIDSDEAWGTIDGDVLVLIFAMLAVGLRSEEHTSELQSLMRSSYAVFCLKTKKKNAIRDTHTDEQNEE